MMNAMTAARPILLYDGTCAFCQATVRLVLRNDTRGTLRFASLQGKHGRAVIAANPELDGVDSIVWVDPEIDGRPARVLTRSQAAFRVARYLGGLWRLWLVFVVIPRPIRDRIYSLVARHRHRLMGTAERCVVPPADARDRFLDEDS